MYVTLVQVQYYLQEQHEEKYHIIESKGKTLQYGYTIINEKSCICSYLFMQYELTANFIINIKYLIWYKHFTHIILTVAVGSKLLARVCSLSHWILLSIH